MITPLLGDSSRQAKTSNGYSRDDFVIDYDTRTATCPQGQSSAHWNQRVHDGVEKIYIAFPQRACWTCDVQPECTSSKIRRRGITVYPRGATAINITRLDAYFTHQPLDRTHSSRLIQLHAATTN